MPVQVDLAGRTALVTGGGSGIGRACAERLAAAGAAVVVLDREEAAAKEVAGVFGGRAVAVDLADPEAVDALDVAGDILVNNAGIQHVAPVEEFPPETFALILRLMLETPFRLARKCLPGMYAAGWGRIVNISSGAGRSVSLTGIQAYASAKAGQIGLTRQTAHELGPFGITVNAIAPGFVLSNPTTQRQWESYGEQGQAALVEGIAVRRLGTPEDIAHGVLFFTADASSWITGQTLSIDGGHALF
jgi:3-oxoacyl-[acyl-carrier protein] reductase